MDVKRMAHGAVYGSRAPVVDRLQEPLARRLRLSPDDVRALFGALFLFWSVRRVFRAVRAGLRG
jgi:hypothetical protein